LTPHFTTEQA